jgi:hypothetical protein
MWVCKTTDVGTKSIKSNPEAIWNSASEYNYNIITAKGTTN